MSALGKRERDWLARSPYAKRMMVKTKTWRPRYPRRITPAVIAPKELKFVDSSFNGSVSNSWNLAAPTSIGALNAIAQGTGESERIGRKVSNNSIHIRGQLAISPATPQSRLVRILVVKDSQTNGAPLSPTDVIASSGTAFAIHGWRNLETVSRFNVLVDKTFALNPDISFDGTATSTNSMVLPIKFNLKCSGTTLYDDTTANISNITDNSYHVLTCASGGGVSFQYNCRFRFTG